LQDGVTVTDARYQVIGTLPVNVVASLVGSAGTNRRHRQWFTKGVNTTMNTVRALLFDTVGTLVDWRGGLIAQLQTWAADNNVTADWAALVDAWRFDFVISIAKVRTGEREWANQDQLQRESIARLAPQHGIPELHDDALDELVRMWHALPPWPDTVAGLRKLRSRYVIAPLSNSHVAMLVDLARAAGITCDTVLGADIFRQYKPDPRTYLGAAALLGCQPAEVMLVASHPSDLDAAAACGLRTCYVSRPMEYGAGQVIEPTPTAGHFDLMVNDLLELAELTGTF
jgi:2-haloacid dehalogenase